MRSSFRTGIVLCVLTLLLSACAGGGANVARANPLSVEITKPVDGGAVEIQDNKINFTYQADEPVQAGWFKLTINGALTPSLCKPSFSPPYCIPADVLRPGAYTVMLSLTLPSGASVSDTVAYHIVSLPPDPGEAGKATLLGIDSDDDGVRDDIQRWIALNYPNSAKKRMALRQDAKAMNNALRDSGDKRKSINNSYSVGYAQECSFFIWGNVREGGKEADKLQAEILNTEERTTAYFTYNDQLGGEVFSTTPIKFWKKRCEINPDDLPN